MSVHKCVWLSCDVCQDPSGDGSLGESSSVAEARQYAKADGWQRRNGMDVCENCANGGGPS